MIFDLQLCCDFDSGYGSLKVIGTRQESIRHIWLPINVQCTSHGHISDPFRDKRRYRSKIHKIIKPRVLFCPRWRGYFEIGDLHSGSKTRVMGLPGRDRSLTMSSVVWVQHTNVQTVGQTDRQRDRHTDSKDHDYAWRRAVKSSESVITIVLT